MKNKSNYIFISLLGALMILFSCVEDDTCTENAISGINVKVKNSGKDQAYDPDTLNEASIQSWLICPLKDSILFNDTVIFDSKDRQGTSPGIPLDLNDTSITIVFYIRDNVNEDYIKDTIHFFYHQKDLKLISVQCGFTPIFELSGGQHTTHVLDSITMYDTEISNDLNLNNVTLFY